MDAMKRKRSSYIKKLECVQGESDPHQYMLACDDKTQLVKFVSIFCLNLVEWMGVTSGLVSLFIHFVGDYQQEFHTNHTLSVLGEWKSKLDIPNFDNTCLEISMCIIGNLCMYLSARYAQKNWIKSNRISLWICFFLLNSIGTQFLVTICYTHILGIWCDIMLLTLSVIFAWKQYRKLNMVLQWSIIDLRVNGDIELVLEKKMLE